MQRSISYQNPLTPLLYAALFILYTALSGIYLFLPPFFAILYVLFSRALKQENTASIFLVSFCLLFFEAQNSYMLFSTIIYFSLIHKYVVAKIKQNFNCNLCVKFSIVFLVYIGFFIFNLLLSNIFLFPMPSINYYVIYYVAVEFLILNLL
jgi:membrane-associated HD superfamily phosphohydrolase